MDIDEIEKRVSTAVKLLKTLSNEKRFMILCNLNRGEKSVGELEKLIGLSQSALSQHLARLRNEGLVETRRDAQTIYYSLTHAECRIIMQCLYDLYCPPEDDPCVDSPDINPETQP